MAGPVPPYARASAASPNESIEDEPWDQRYATSGAAATTTNVNSMGPYFSNSNRQQQAMGVRVSEENLDDGDLPSLSSRVGYGGAAGSNSNSASRGNSATATAATPTTPTGGGRIIGGQKTTTRPLKPSSDKGLKTLSPQTSSRRNFWGQMEPSKSASFENATDEEDMDKNNTSNANVADASATRRPSTQRSTSGRKNPDEEGPDDEMAARRQGGNSNNSRPLNSSNGQTTSLPTSNRTPVKEYDADNSVPTDVESQLTEEDEEEEEEESRYETSFCGQTLNAIGDMCGGGGLNLTGGRGRDTDARSPTSKDAKALQGNASIGRKGSSRSPLSLRDETQQENTAIEVEFVEPVVRPQPVAAAAVTKAADVPLPPVSEGSVGGSGTGVVEVQRKNAYLSAMAKKAKENFQNKKGKQAKVSQRDVGVTQTEPVSRLQPLQAMSSLIDVEESATDIASSVKGDGAFDVEGNGPVTGSDSASSGTGGGDDYNSFNATEKRKFIKLINSGVSAGVATRQIMDDRTMPDPKRSHLAIETGVDRAEVGNKAAKVSTRLPFWRRSSESDLHAEPTGGDDDPLEDNDNRESERSASLVTPTSDDLEADAVVPEEDEEEDPRRQQEEIDEVEPPENPSEARSVSDIDSIPFEKSGSHYYDAVRRDYDEESFVSADDKQRGLDFSKALEIARAQRLFGAAKSKGKGFTALSDSPARRATSAPRQRLPFVGENRQLTGHHQLEDSIDDSRLVSDEVESEIAGTLSIGRTLSNHGNEDLPNQDPPEGRWEDLLPNRERSSLNSVSKPGEAKAFGTTEPDVENDDRMLPVLSSRNVEMDDFPLTGPNVLQQPLEAIQNGVDALPVEQNVLSMTPRPELTSAERNVEAVPVTMSTERNLDPVSLPTNFSDRISADRMLSSETPRESKIESAGSNMDVSMDTYFKSTNDAYSVAEGTHHQSDAVSVYTAGTAITGVTNYTQSSRVRRPGVAKTRLAKQKQIEQQRASKRGQGWHETIRSAAESAQRKWDPKRGWIDYEEPESVSAASLPVVKEKIRIDLDRSVLSHKEMDTSREQHAHDPSVTPVPFPEEWQKERDAMIHNVARNNMADVSFQSERSATAEQARTIANQQEDMEEPKTKGWVESMRAASAALAKEGKVWDPVHGWSSVNKRGQDVPNTVDFDEPTSYDKPSPSDYLVDVAMRDGIVGDGPAQFDVDTAPQNERDPHGEAAHFVLSYPEEDAMPDQEPSQDNPTVDAAVDLPHVDPTRAYDDTANTNMKDDFRGGEVSASVATDLAFRSSSLPGLPEPTDKINAPVPHSSSDIGKKLNRWIAKKTEMVPRHRSELSAENSDLAVGSGTASREELDERPEAVVTPEAAPESTQSSAPFSSRLGIMPHRIDLDDYEKTPSLVQSGEFPLHDDVNVVDVVKEKVDERDMDLFSEDSKSPRNNRSRLVVSATDMESSLSHVPRRISPYQSPERAVSTPRGTASVMSADLSVATSRRGGGPVDTDEVDETWDSDDDERHSKDWLSNTSRAGKSGIDLLPHVSHNTGHPIPEVVDDHQHIKGWKETGAISTSHSSRNALTHSVDAPVNMSALTAVSPLKRVPRLERSKRDTSPLSVRKVADLGFPANDDGVTLADQIGTALHRDVSPFRARPEPTAETEATDPAAYGSAAFEHTAFAETATSLHTDKRGSLQQDDALPVDSNIVSPTGRQFQTGSLVAKVRSNLDGLLTPPGSQHEKIQREVNSPESPSVKDRLREWETRIEASYSTDAGESVEHARKLPSEALSPGGMAGWKSFLGKKVQAASAAAIAASKTTSTEKHGIMMSTEQPQHASPTDRNASAFVKRTQTDEDSLFEFVNKRGSNRGAPVSLDISDLSPINMKDDLSDDVEYAESGYGPTEEERRSSSFLQRLSECAAPMMTTKQVHGESQPGAFLGPTSFMPTAICGKQDVVEEPESVAETSNDSLNSSEKHRRSMSFGDEKPRSKSKPRDKVKAEMQRVSSSSVVSEDFGSKTAYLDSVAMKAAVSKTRRSRSGSRRNERSGDSSVASNSTIHSEKWKSFLERKRAADPSPLRSRASSTDVSRAAEKYASQKVDEIMTKMKSRSRTVTRSREVHKEVEQTEPEEKRNSSTVNDAEDLAAARVEAMMAALSSSHLDEGEI